MNSPPLAAGNSFCKDKEYVGNQTYQDFSANISLTQLLFINSMPVHLNKAEK